MTELFSPLLSHACFNVAPLLQPQPFMRRLTNSTPFVAPFVVLPTQRASLRTQARHAAFVLYVSLHFSFFSMTELLFSPSSCTCLRVLDRVLTLLFVALVVNLPLATSLPYPRPASPVYLARPCPHLNPTLARALASIPTLIWGRGQ